MKYSSILGILLGAVGALLFLLQEPDYSDLDFYIAGLLGLGIGLFLGGIMGFAQKKRKKVVEPKFETKTEENFKNKIEEKTDDSGLKL